MARVLHGIPIGTLPEPGELSANDQVVAYRESDGVAYRTNVSSLAAGGLDLLNSVYPVGSIYMSVQNISPDVFIGGTWEKIQDQFLLAAGSDHEAGETGGEEAVALSDTQIPAHSHSLPSHTHSLPSHTHSIPSHTHSIPSHNHSIPSHTHSVPTHTHSFSATTSSNGSHDHDLYYRSDATTGGSARRLGTSSDYTGTNSTAILNNGAHTHTVSGTTGSNSSANTGSYSGTTGSYSGTTGSTSGTSGSTSGTSGATTGTSGEAGGDQAHNNMPPYLAVYMWQRVA